MGNQQQVRIEEKLELKHQLVDYTYDSRVNIYVSMNNNQEYCRVDYNYFNWEEYSRMLELFKNSQQSPDKNIVNVKSIQYDQKNNLCTSVYRLEVLYEYYNHKLVDQMEKRKRENRAFNIYELLSILRSIFNALKYLQKNNKHHSNVDSRNIVIDSNNYYRLVDLCVSSGSDMRLINYDYFCLGVLILECCLLKKFDSCDNYIDKYQFNINAINILKDNKNIINTQLYELIYYFLTLNRSTSLDISDIEKYIKNIEQSISDTKSIQKCCQSGCDNCINRKKNQQIDQTLSKLYMSFDDSRNDFYSCPNSRNNTPQKKDNSINQVQTVPNRVRNVINLN